MVAKIIIDADFCIKLGGSNKHGYLYDILPMKYVIVKYVKLFIKVVDFVEDFQLFFEDYNDKPYMQKKGRK